MTVLTAHVVAGRIVVDEPTDLPDGAEVRVYLDEASNDELSAAERAALDRAIDAGIAQAEAGDSVDADEVLAELHRG